METIDIKTKIDPYVESSHRPLIYDVEKDIVYRGRLGSHHEDLIEKVPGFSWASGWDYGWEDDDNWTWASEME